MGVFKRAVKKASKALSRVVRRRYIHKKSGGVKFRRIAKDVMYLKSIVNAEKKRWKLTSLSSGPPVVASFKTTTGTDVNNNFLALDITPYLTLGDAPYNRQGVSVKLHSSYMRLQIDQQTANNMSGKLRVVMVQVKGVPQTSATTFASRVFCPDSWTTLQFGGTILPDGTYQTGPQMITANSNYNPDYYGEYKVLMSRTVRINQKNFSGTASGLLREVSIPFRWNRGKGHHIRYISGSNTGSVADLANGQIFMYVLADVGNGGTVNYTGTGSGLIPSNVASSGYTINYDLTHYYYDN